MGEGMRNKIRKKILSLLLAGILAAGLCGCGQEAETQKTQVAMIVKSTESAFGSVFAGAGAAATEYNINISFDGKRRKIMKRRMRWYAGQWMTVWT